MLRVLPAKSTELPALATEDARPTILSADVAEIESWEPRNEQTLMSKVDSAEKLPACGGLKTLAWAERFRPWMSKEGNPP